MDAPHLLSQAVIAENVLHETGFPRLHVRAYGQHLVIYTQEDDVGSHLPRRSVMPNWY